MTLRGWKFGCLLCLWILAWAGFKSVPTVNAAVYTWTAAQGFEQAEKTGVLFRRNPLLTEDFMPEDIILKGDPTEYGDEIIPGIGTADTDEASAPFVMKLVDGTYRIYYTYTAGYGQLAYRESGDSISGWREQKLLNIRDAADPFLLPYLQSGYRIYYTKINPAENFLAYKSLDSDGITTLTGEKTLGLGSSASDSAMSPYIMEAFGQFHIYYSLDNGSNTNIASAVSTNGVDGWSNTNTAFLGLGSGINQRRDPFLIQQAEGSFRLYYTRSNGIYGQLAYRASPDGISNWSEEALLGIGSADNTAAGPFLMADNDGQVRLYYHSKDAAYGDFRQIKMRESKESFTGWGVPQATNIGGAEERLRGFYILHTKDGQYRVYYPAGNFTSAQWYTRISPDGLSNWSDAISVNLDTPAGGSPFIHKFPDNTYRMYYSIDEGDGLKLVCRESTDGVNWEAAIDIGIGKTDSEFPADQPFLMRLSDGTYRMYYTKIAADSQIVYAVSDNGYSDWQNPNTALFPGESQDPFLMKRSDGSYCLFYTALLAGGGSQLLCRISSDGLSQWSEPAPAGAGVTVLESARSPFVMMDESGKFRLYFLYGDSAAEEWQLRYCQKQTNFVSSGTLIGPVLDSGSSQVWQEIEWDPSLSYGTSLTLQTRSGNSPVPDNEWSVWSAANSGGRATISSPSGRYIQWKAAFFTNDSFCSPHLKSVSIHYDTHVVAEPVLKAYKSLFRPNKGEQVRLEFKLPAAGQVSLKIYNLRGEHIVTLLDKINYPSGGPYSVSWAANNEAGSVVSSGIYLVLLETPNGKRWKKVAIVK